MYLCAAETTKAVVTAVRTTKNDKTHTGQFEYSIWLRIIRDSAEIIKRHGLFPQPNKNLKSILPQLNTFHLHWDQPTKKTKHDLTVLVKDTFAPRAKLLSSVGNRSLGQPKCYNKRWPLSSVQLVLQAYKIKQVKSTHACILDGGKYHPFDETTDTPRDSIQFKIEGLIPLKAISFEQLALKSDEVVLNPQVLAAAIYIDKSITDKEKNTLAKLKNCYKAWKSQQGGTKGYLQVKQLRDPEGGGGGGGGGGGASKRIKKTELAKPLERLALQFKELYRLIGTDEDAANEFLTGPMTDSFKDIAAAATVTTEPVFGDESEATDGDDESNEGENEYGHDEQGNKGDSDSDDSDGESRAKTSGNDNSSGSEEEGSDKDDDSVNNSTDDDNTKEDKADSNDNHNGKPPSRCNDAEEDANKNDATNEPKTSTDEQEEDSLSKLLGLTTLTSCSRNNIDTFLNIFSGVEGCDLESADCNGEALVPWLNMRKTPKNASQMKFFYLIRTKHKAKIASLFEDDAVINDDSWMTTLVSLLKYISKFDWNNSFEHLPDGAEEKDEYFLLWLSNAQFEKTFFNQMRNNSPRKAKKND